MGEWKEVLDRLLKEVQELMACFFSFRKPRQESPSAPEAPQEDEACRKLLEDSLAYAVYAVNKNEAEIRDTIRNRVKASPTSTRVDLGASSRA